MKVQELFETKMRGQSWPSMQDARASILSDPLAAEYIFDILVKHRAIAVNPDGTVRGVAPLERVTEVEGSKPAKKWGDGWPSKWQISSALCGMALPLAKIRAELAKDGFPAGHWVTLHALWYLQKQGQIVKLGKGYAEVRLDGEPIVDGDDDSDEAGRARAERTKKHNATWLKALQKAGSPYEWSRVREALEPIKADLDYSAIYWETIADSADEMNSMIDILRKKGLLPPAGDDQMT